jgi:hypothetical protein
MTTRSPLITDPTNGKPAEITSTDKLGLFAGGTSVGEALVYAQAGARLVDLTLTGDLAIQGNTTIGDASADTITVNAGTLTLPATQALNVVKPAQASTAEQLFVLKVNDSLTQLIFGNNTSNPSQFAPFLEGKVEAGVDSNAFAFNGTKGVNSGSGNACLLFLGRANVGAGNVDIADDQIFVEMRNRIATIWQYLMYGDGSIKRCQTANRDTQQYQAAVTTADATQTTLKAITLGAGATYHVEAKVVARRTSGGGSADDGASYERRGTYTTKSGSVTLMGSVQTIGTDAEDQSAWDMTITISGSTVLVRVTGASATSITWFGDITVRRVAA